MIYVDTHTHLYLREEFGPEGAMAVERAIAAGVTKMVLPNVDLTTVDDLLHLHTRFPEHTYPAFGLHPTEVRADWEEALSRIRPLFESHRSVAVGEVGIDMYWDKQYREEQMQALERQMSWAVEMNLPMIIHCREGLDEVLEVISGFGSPLPEMVFHSFGGSADDVERIRRYGDFYFGINGVVTFKNAQTLRDALPTIGIERILLETDSPYLSPVPYRGKRNQSAYIPIIASKIAEVLSVGVEYVAEQTTANANHLFRLM